MGVSELFAKARDEADRPRDAEGIMRDLHFKARKNEQIFKILRDKDGVEIWRYHAEQLERLMRLNKLTPEVYPFTFGE
jgi:hypothetical protein